MPGSDPSNTASAAYEPDLTWAWEKWMRATEHVADLRAEVDHWAETRGQQIDSGIGEDRLSWWVESRIDNWPPPLTHWALVAGDAIHNLRSVLDVLVWCLADTGSLTDPQRKALQFPIVTDPAKWEADGPRRLRSVPEPYLTRIRDGQPCWLDQAQRDLHGLSLIHDLDIQDKHRHALGAQPVPAVAEIAHLIEFATDDPNRVLPPWTIDDSRAANGVLRYEGTTHEPIVRISGRLNVLIELTLETPNGPGYLFHLLTLMSALVHDVLCGVSGAPAPFPIPVPLYSVYARWPHRQPPTPPAASSRTRRRRPLRRVRLRPSKRLALQRQALPRGARGGASTGPC